VGVRGSNPLSSTVYQSLSIAAFAWSEGFSYEFDERGPVWTLVASVHRAGGIQENFRLPLRDHRGVVRHGGPWSGLSVTAIAGGA
jgi:hypothetical protein